ncbi:MAG: acyl carrier protein [Magnetovibrionaceae bacterium]
MMTKDEIFAELSRHLIDLFEVPEDEITADALLFEDLDLDSIDAVDLIVKLQEMTGRKIPPEDFKTVRSVGDIVERVHEMMRSSEAN